ncbi:hypothetical protein [Methylobacterium symbioticum]|uniref:Uncharacterized protein n=1 Tax=Methylobacterium symbioticum TaxID=2584084 RepID=A0A509EC18_9HYPH|nr:hypothetical protein [Methylobacterium symbioticum]VUD71787.1 hypothetical protein MET9862_02375 [Methylobacterium symbioticum]
MAGPRFSGTLVEDEPAAPRAGPRFSGTLVEDDLPAAGLPGDGSAAIGRGIINGIPVAGPYLLGGLNRVAAGIRSLKNDTKFSDELRTVERFGEATEKANPIASTVGEVGGGIAGTVPLVAAAPVAFGAGAGSLAARSLASGLSGSALGGADSAARNGGDANSIATGAAIGGVLGGAGPGVGRLVGKGVAALRGGEPGAPLVREALAGLSDSELASAQFIRDQARALPGGGVDLPLDEVVNAATGGKGARLSQLARVAANSGGEGGQRAAEVYAGRPASVDNVARAAFEQVAPQNPNPSRIGPAIQEAAQAGVTQTPEGIALSRARTATGPRITPEQAGQAIQTDLRGVRDLREAARSSRANVDYRLAREAPENVGIERMVTVERPGEPIITYPEGRPQFLPDAPRPLEKPAFDPIQGDAGGESLARFVARNGGIDLSGDARAADLQRFNIPGLGTVARPGGKSIDNFWREFLVDHGYLKPDADGGAARDVTNELLRLLQNEQRAGQAGARFPIYSERTAGRTASSQADEFQNALQTWSGRFDEDLTRAGIDPASVHPEIRSRVMGALMRGEEGDPLAAFERTVGAMREPPAPYVKSTVIEEQIPDVRFGQVDPRPALAAIDRQASTAKGDVASTLGSIRRMLFRGGDTDMSVEGMLHARERIDRHIAEAVEIGDATKVRDLETVRTALDGQLKRVPEVAVADANFARNSVPLEPFAGNNPLGRIVRRDELTGRMAMPAEQVPGTLSGPTALREALANGGPATRESVERHLTTQLVERATGADGNLSADALRMAMREHADVLDQIPAVRDRLSNLVVAREGMSRVEASPLGRLAESPDVSKAIRTVFAANPAPGSQAEVAGAMAALARNRPSAARDLARIYLESVFNEATQQVKGIASQYGGAGFASAVRGNPQQRHNLEAVVRALPDGDTLWGGLDRLLTTLEATGYRPQKGSDTAFNTAIREQLKSGTPVRQAVADVASGTAAGASVGGVTGAAGGALVGLRRGVSDALVQARVMGNTDALARLIFDPKAVPDLRALARSPAGSPNAELFTSRLLSLAYPATPAREGSRN